ncbi:hypothetical protein ASJ79_12270 [Mycobacterium sp. NAZ190054]|nr:hypothetical protein ASJ79_12270 [Mycobacterium sp. NAZ190054]
MIFCGMAVAADWIAPYDPTLIVGAPLEPAGDRFLLGTDNLGRDVLSQLIYGSRASVYVGILGALASTTIGILIGAVAGYFGGRIDTVLMRVAELFQVLPALIVALVMAALWGGSLMLVVIVIGVTTWPNEARIMRGQVMSLRDRDFVNLARTSGFGPAHILFSDVIPNAIPPLIVQAALGVGGSILVEAGLSFIGVGDPNAGSWGQMLNIAQPYLPVAPWLSILPGLAIVLMVLGFNLIADGLNRAMSPRGSAAAAKQRARVLLRRLKPSAKVTEKPILLPHGEPAPLLEVDDLRVWFDAHGTQVKAVNGVSVTVAAGECVGVVGESGSGKSTLARMVTRLLPPVSISQIGGDVRLDGQEVLSMSESALARFRRGRISMVFQEPLNHLNPTMRIGAQIAGGLPPGLSKAERKARVDELLAKVELPSALGIARRYPHELSGGQRQRVMIALALALEPRLLIADEPTTALDATVQAQVLNTLMRLREEENLAILLITHDLGLVASMCDRVYVMRGGEVVESGELASVFQNPESDYTRELLAARRDGSGLTEIGGPR